MSAVQPKPGGNPKEVLSASTASMARSRRRSSAASVVPLQALTGRHGTDATILQSNEARTPTPKVRQSPLRPKVDARKPAVPVGAVQPDPPRTGRRGSVFGTLLGKGPPKAERIAREYEGILSQLGCSFRNERLAEISKSELIEHSHARFILDPDNTFRRVWTLLILTMVVFTAVWLPYVFSFQPEVHTGMKYVELCVDGLFLVDVFLNFRFSYYEDTLLVRDATKIARRYLTGWFLIDFLSCFPLELLFGQGGRSLLLVSALKCIRLMRIRRFVVWLKAKPSKYANLLAIARLYIFITGFSHWMACAWYSLASVGDGEWLVSAGIDQSSLGERYATSLTHSLTMLIRTTPYPPSTTAEKWFLVFMTLVGAYVQATVFGQVAHLVASINLQSATFRRQMRDIFDRMDYHKLPPALQTRIGEYLETMWKKHRLTVGEKPLGFTSSLSEPLQNEVNLFMNRKLLGKVPMFRECELGVIIQVISCLMPLMFMPGEYVVRAGEIGDRMYFVRTGKCRVLLPDKLRHRERLRKDSLSDSKGRVLRTAKTLSAGDYFGEISLLYRMRRTATICAATYADLSCLNHMDFEKILEDNPEFAGSIEKNFSQYVTDTPHAPPKHGEGESSESGGPGADRRTPGITKKASSVQDPEAEKRATGFMQQLKMHDAKRQREHAGVRRKSFTSYGYMALAVSRAGMISKQPAPEEPKSPGKAPADIMEPRASLSKWHRAFQKSRPAIVLGAPTRRHRSASTGDVKPSRLRHLSEEPPQAEESEPDDALDAVEAMLKSIESVAEAAWPLMHSDLEFGEAEGSATASVPATSVPAASVPPMLPATSAAAPGARGESPDPVARAVASVRRIPSAKVQAVLDRMPRAQRVSVKSNLGTSASQPDVLQPRDAGPQPEFMKQLTVQQQNQWKALGALASVIKKERSGTKHVFEALLASQQAQTKQIAEMGDALAASIALQSAVVPLRKASLSLAPPPVASLQASPTDVIRLSGSPGRPPLSRQVSAARRPSIDMRRPLDRGSSYAALHMATTDISMLGAVDTAADIEDQVSSLLALSPSAATSHLSPRRDNPSPETVRTVLPLSTSSESADEAGAEA